jgi:hypothetical protein
MFFWPKKALIMQYLVDSQAAPHKILGLAPRIASLAGLLLCLTVFGLLQSQKARFVFLPDGVHFVDGDCYSRMTRARIVAENPGTVVRTHAFENYPFGVRPHTSAPMDYLIVGTQWLSGGRLDMDFAGAWISPILGGLLIFMAWLWGERRKLAYRWSMVALLSTSPILLHGFAVGRPDHQSLVLLLTTSGILSETALWRRRSLSTSLWWGLSWGFALWVSWFEPFILLILVLIVRALVWRTQCLARTWIPPLAIAALVMILAILLEGLPDAGLGRDAGFFLHWIARIGELQSFNPLSAAIAWIGWLSLLAPFSLAWLALKRDEVICWLWLTLLLSMGALTGWHARWGYFLALAGALAMPHALSTIHPRWLGYALFAASLWPVASTLERELFPQGEAGRILAENLHESQHLRQAAQAVKDLEGDGILGPWWLTPQLVYWSEKSGVAGTSHEALAGTVASARFFVAQDELEAQTILRERQPDFVVVCDADRLLDNSYTVLGTTGERANQLAATLFRTPSRCPIYLRLVFQNPYFKVYQVQKERLQ